MVLCDLGGSEKIWFVSVLSTRSIIEEDMSRTLTLLTYFLNSSWEGKQHEYWEGHHLRQWRPPGDIAQQLVELFVGLDSKSNVTRHSTTLLVITSGVASKLKLESQHRDTREQQQGRRERRHQLTLAVLSLTQVTTDTTDGELQASLGGRRNTLLLTTATLSFSRHDDVCLFLLLLQRR
jgi:hypothetical protein